MAANNYYSNNSFHQYGHAQPYQDNTYDNDRSNEALPPLPSHSPFDDQTYPNSHKQPSQSYAGSSGRLGDEDPFEDPNAVPLSRKKHDSTATVSPILPHEQEDPFVRDVDPSRQRRRRQKDGWFTGRITWVVYFLTVVQLIVFLAEIIKNGE